ncbi:MAG: Uma2 family endonuclease [Drouetiella hepatica Uher 2000/2452]|jgi:Uma2 family endonuclease|uniref:Uma2 family endonuclease n=1 Tax=Drouetiella hepatica Uher 2000/2452 TaxID=904376 RepID=A0A951QEC2_9CYAN|nr:Uma2 family endonuclease [Drouetiella hepatica Uher 2000/2452]
MTTLGIRIPRITAEKFQEICQANPNLRLELTANGEVIAMSPTYFWTGKQNSGLTAQLWNWNDRTELGIVFDSSAGFTLPNGAVRSPDAAWIVKERWNNLTEEQQRYAFSSIAPDFVVELRSSSDDLAILQVKMQEYLDNGVQLGWLIDPQQRRVEIYRMDQPAEILELPVTLSGENLLPGFELQLSKVWGLKSED